jgi:hypothetical protein
VGSGTPQIQPSKRFLSPGPQEQRRDAWLNASGATPEELKLRTLTALYNEHPQWLQNLHKNLDWAVCAAYGWPGDIRDNEILEHLLSLNHSRAAQLSIIG